MNLRKAGVFVLLSVVAALTMYACGGGGGGGGSAAPTPQTPTVNTAAAVPGIDNALLVGEVNPRGLPTYVWFEYGTDSNLAGANSTILNKKAAGDNSATVQVTSLVPGLEIYKDFYYRVVAENSAGQPVKGNIVAFKTKAPTPTANTILPNILPADNNIGLDWATLRGEVNPNGLAADVSFQISEFTDLSDNPTPIPVTTLPGGKGIIKVSTTRTGLTRDTTYYYRVVAKNAGIPLPVNGGIKSFKTLPNPLPVANAGPDNTVGPPNIAVNDGAITVPLDGSKSFDQESGTIATYKWEQVGTPAVTFTSTTSQKTTFIVPPTISIPYPGLDLNFNLTVGSSRGPYFSTDATKVTVKWGFLDDFSTNTAVGVAGIGSTDPHVIDYFTTTGGYTVTVYSDTIPWVRVDGEGMQYFPEYAQAQMSTNHGVILDHALPSSSQGVFSVDFSPIQKYGDGAGIEFRLVQDANNYFEISNGVNDGWRAAPAIKKVVGGVVVYNHPYTETYNPVAGGAINYPIKITFSPTVLTWEAFGNSGTYSDPTPGGRSITVNGVVLNYWQQDATIDNILLEPLP